MILELKLDKNDLIKVSMNKPIEQIRIEDLQAIAFKQALRSDRVIFIDEIGSTKVLKDNSRKG